MCHFSSNSHVVAVCLCISIIHAGVVLLELLSRQFTYRVGTKELFGLVFSLPLSLLSAALLLRRYCDAIHLRPAFVCRITFKKTIIRPHIKSTTGLTGVVFPPWRRKQVVRKWISHDQRVHKCNLITLKSASSSR